MTSDVLRNFKHTRYCTLTAGRKETPEVNVFYFFWYVIKQLLHLGKTLFHSAAPRGSPQVDNSSYPTKYLLIINFVFAL